MAQTIKLKRSATSGAIPTTSSLALGEVAINTYDGKMYIKKDVGGTETVVQVGAGADSVSYLEAGMIEYEYTATSNQTSFSGSILKLSRIIQESLFFRQHLIDVLGLRSPDPPENKDITQLSFC